MIIYIVKVSDLEKKWTLSPWPSEDFWQISYEKNHFSPLKIAFLVLKIFLENFLNQTQVRIYKLSILPTFLIMIGRYIEVISGR